MHMWQKNTLQNLLVKQRYFSVDFSECVIRKRFFGLSCFYVNNMYHYLVSISKKNIDTFPLRAEIYPKGRSIQVMFNVDCFHF